MTKSMPPTEAARKTMMAAARSSIPVPNSFFISSESGEIISRAWRDERAHFPNIPAGQYEMHIQRNRFYTYADLQADIDSVMASVWQQEEMLHRSEQDFLQDMVRMPIEQIQMQYGYNEAKIKELRQEAARKGIVP